MALSLLIRILECFANCLIFSLKVVYFSNTIHFISEGSANMWIWWNGSKEVSYCAGGIFMILEWLSSGMSPVHIIFCLQDTEQHFIPVQVIPGWAHSSFQWPFSNEIIVLVQRQVIQAHEWESLCNNNYYKGSYGDLSNHYLGVKNSNKDTSEFLTCVFV